MNTKIYWFWLKSIKCIHNNFFGNLDVIITGNFYQVQPIPNAWIFKINANNIDSLTPNFWMEKIKCNELKQVMHQSDEQFINILNWFQTITQLQLDVDNINNQCFCTPPNDPKFPYLFYTNEAKQNHNESVFLWNERDVFILHAQDRHHDICPQSFQL
jgi:hypothetical protein